MTKSPTMCEPEKEVDSSDDLLPTGADLAHQLEAFLRGQES